VAKLQDKERSPELVPTSCSGTFRKDDRVVQLNDWSGLQVLPRNELKDRATVSKLVAGRGHPRGVGVVPAADPHAVTRLQRSAFH
jgi:hypothetical protein